MFVIFIRYIATSLDEPSVIAYSCHSFPLAEKLYKRHIKTLMKSKCELLTHGIYRQIEQYYII